MKTKSKRGFSYYFLQRLTEVFVFSLTEFAVVLQINIHKRRHLAFLVEKTETWAVLRIDEIKTEKASSSS